MPDFALCLRHIYQGTTEMCRTQLNRAVFAFSTNFGHCGFEIEPIKSAVVVFIRHKLQSINSIVMDNVQFPWRNNAKYLGLVVDQKMTWYEHINNIIAKAEKGLNIMKVKE